jgi:adenine phosphoribosyltransferase
VDARGLEDHVRDVADFPRPGILFKDITPLLGHAEAFRHTVDTIAGHFAGHRVDKVLGVEARGFIVAAPVAYRFGAGFVPVRKPGKLPWDTEAEAYELEYGTDRLEMHRDAVAGGDRVLVVDDVIATGGTACAAIRLVEKLGASVVGLAFVIELAFLGGRDKLEGYEAMSLITYGQG